MTFLRSALTVAALAAGAHAIQLSSSGATTLPATTPSTATNAPAPTHTYTWKPTAPGMCGNEKHQFDIDYQDAYKGVPHPNYDWATCKAACASFPHTKGCTGIESEKVCRVHVAGDNTAEKALIDTTNKPETTYIDPPQASRTYHQSFNVKGTFVYTMISSFGRNFGDSVDVGSPQYEVINLPAEQKIGGVLVRGSGGGGAHKPQEERAYQVTKVKVYAWDNTVSPAVWKQLTNSTGGQIFDTYVPIIHTADKDGPLYQAERNKQSTHMFSKPVTTSKIKIELVACHVNPYNTSKYQCYMRTGLIGPHVITSAASKLSGTKCALVQTTTVVDPTNGGLADDDEFIKAIKSRPTWDAYAAISQAHGSRRQDRDAKAEKYVAQKVQLATQKANLAAAEAALTQAKKDSETAIAAEGEATQKATDAKAEAVKAQQAVDAAKAAISSTAEADLQNLRTAAIEAHKLFVKHLKGTSTAAKSTA